MDEQPQAPDHDVQANTDSSASAEEQLALALRLLVQQHGGEGGESALRLLPGSLPADLPLNLPLPPGARLVGSLAHGQSPESPYGLLATILVDAPLTGEQVSEFYIERMEALGWRLEGLPPRGGFAWVQPGGFAHLNFTAPANDYVVMMTAQPRQSDAGQAGAPPTETPPQTTLSILARREDPQMAARRRGMGPDHRQGDSLIPTLMPPPGASQQGGGGGGGMGRWQANARMESERPADEVIAWYDRQLAQSGWTRRDGGANGPVGWSFWSFTDAEGEPWRGLIVALSNPDYPSHYFVIIEIEAENEQNPQQKGGGYSTYGMLGRR